MYLLLYFAVVAVAVAVVVVAAVAVALTSITIHPHALLACIATVLNMSKIILLLLCLIFTK